MTPNYNRLGTLVGEGSPPEVLAYLKDRGVPRKVARAANLRVLTPAQTAAVWPGCNHMSLLVPFADDYGAARMFGVKQKRNKWRSTAAPVRIYEPKLTLEHRRETSELLIIEGPIKVLAAIANGRPAIGLTGCWNWQKDRQPIDRLRAYRWAGRVVTPVFDADITENDNVLVPYLLLGDWLQSQGAKVKHVAIPPLKKNRRAGFDDYVAVNGVKGFDDLKRKSWDGAAVEKLRTSVMRTTEGGLAAMFVNRYESDVRHDPDEERWYAWTGTRFRRQAKRPPDIQEAMKETIKSLIADANLIGNADRRKKMLSWAVKCDQRRTIRDAIELASSDPRIRVAHDDFDADQHLLGCKNGIVDLRTHRLLKGSRDQYVSQSVAVAYDPEATCPKWEEFIKQIMLKDRDLIDFMQRLCGYFLLGNNPDRLIFFLYGEGRNGKSVFIETFRKLMGSYGLAAKSELIMQDGQRRDNEAAQPFMIRLRNKRYVTAAEVADGMALDAATVKTLTGGDQMSARGLHKEPISFTVIAKIIVRCNYRPTVVGGDQAIWDRIIEIPFDYRVKDDDVNPTLMEELEAGLPGILNWALKGHKEINKAGRLGIPLKVQHQTAKYRVSMDSLSAWLDENTVKDFGARTKAGVLRSDYEAYCKEASKSHNMMIAPHSQDTMNSRLLDAGYVKRKNSERMWHGVRLKERQK